MIDARVAQEVPIRLRQDRFDRLGLIAWWDQTRLAAARVLVIGAGALGNEVLKNLALLGVGNIVIADMDRIELSNLSRSVLFRETDEGSFKAEGAARAVRAIYPAVKAKAIVGNVLSGVGLGYFRWADVVVGAVDNREARVFINSSCARVGRPWIDGGIDVLSGIVRGFNPPGTACYECTMSEVDWTLIRQRRSCSLLARRAAPLRDTPTTATTASVIGGMQSQEVIKLLHGMDALLGRAFLFEGTNHGSYPITYARKPECPWHEPVASIETRRDYSSQTRLRAIWDHAERRLHGLDAIDFSRELVEELECIFCGRSQRVMAPVEFLTPEQITCESCGRECSPKLVHSAVQQSALLDLRIGELGLPAWDILWARRGAESIGYEIAGDMPHDVAGEARGARRKD